jgi:FtsP/CotA-like multicopper oxidase with cupredoxin domain
MLKSIYNQRSAIDLTKRLASILTIVAILFATLPLDILAANSGDVLNVNATAGVASAQKQTGFSHKIQMMAQRKAEATKFKDAYVATQVSKVNPKMDPGGVPHYFGPYPNYAYTKLPLGPITGIKVDTGGSGYKNPSITIQDVYGTGTGATATATVENGVITKIDLTSPGKDYTAPVVLITDSTGSQGTGATATATIDGPKMSGGIRKFVDSLPGLTASNANNNGQYIPVAIPDQKKYKNCDYYEIELGQFTEKLHSDLPPTTLRGYRQVNTKDHTCSKFSYLGPLIIAHKGRPVRIKFINKLPTGTGGNLFIPVDHTLMGAGMGPLGMNAKPMDYTENRADIHLHGGLNTWISDGTTNQWTTPADENTPYPKGVDVYNVPDMDGGKEPQGTLTYYYNNEQSARLMFYHDHALGITRLNVYAGEAAGYLLTDQVEQDLIAGTNVMGFNPDLKKLLPDTGIPLIIQDKTFVDASTIAAQDPTWKWGTNPKVHTNTNQDNTFVGTSAIAAQDSTSMRGKKPYVPNTGDLWYPHVYMPTLKPDGTDNPFGRWDYAGWDKALAPNLKYGPKPNPYSDPANPGYAPGEPKEIPGTPNPSNVMEAYMDTPLVNGAAYPYMVVQPKAYRFRILNGADDRFWNLQLYEADSKISTADGRTNTEPDLQKAGPSFIQIGTEGGFLPAPVVVNNQPITYDNVGNVDKHALLLGCDERADVIVDFSKYAGKTLILYNDAPAGFPAGDPRFDYYTGNPDLTSQGGTPSTKAGFGPNTRTIMQIRVANSNPDAQYDLDALNATFAKTATKKGVFEAGQDPVLVPSTDYNSAYNATFPDQYVNSGTTSLTFQTLSGKSVTIPLQLKAIQDAMPNAYDSDYGRMKGFLGLGLPNTAAGTQNYNLYPFSSPPVEIIKDSGVIGEPLAEASDGTQIWKFTHYGTDTHPIHFHLFNVQLINRVAPDGSTILQPDANELGWKDTVRMSAMEDTIVALRPTAPQNQPFEIPNAVRLIDPTMPKGAVLSGPPGGFKDPQGNPVTVTNHKVNFGWEYVYHCHVLGHEENDMMHAMVFAVAPRPPTNLKADLKNTNKVSSVKLSWKDNSISETGFTIQRADNPRFKGLTAFKVGPNVDKYTDTTINKITNNMRYYYRVQANNVVGDTGTAGFPTMSANSAFSNIASTPPIHHGHDTK